MTRFKLTILTSFLAVAQFLAQQIPPPPPFEDDGGSGTTGTGAPYPNSIIDQYLFVFILVGIAVIFFVQYKINQKNKKKRYTTISRQIDKRKENRTEKRILTAEINKS